MSQPIPVFYDPRQNCDSIASFSPSAGKPAKVIQDWLGHEKIAPNIEIMPFDPTNNEMLYAAHAKAYVDGVLDGTIANGFGDKSPDLAASLPYTVGSMVAAARHVLQRNDPSLQLNVAVSPTSGFHHAGYDFGGGYCTFNGLMVAAIHVHQLGLAKRILILDMDQHYGNGTQDIIDHLGIDYVTNLTAEATYATADEALHTSDLLNSHLICTRCESLKYDLILYQAGADMHVNDPLGGLLTTQQMRERDANVFWSAKVTRTPIVWNLAGGYQRGEDGGIEPVLALHRQTIQECIRNMGF